MFLACSSPKESEESEENSRNLTVTILSFNEKMQACHTHVQPTTDTDDTAEISVKSNDLQKERKFLVFEPCLLSLFS